MLSNPHPINKLPVKATMILHTSLYAKTSPSLRSKFLFIKIPKSKLKYEAIIHRGSHPAWRNSTEELRHGPPLNAATGVHCGTRMSLCPHHLQSASSGWHQRCSTVSLSHQMLRPLPLLPQPHKPSSCCNLRRPQSFIINILLPFWKPYFYCSGCFAVVHLML